MAIIPAQEKVFMVSNGTNTTYGGSAALQAMNQWYTMQDVVETVGILTTPTLQQVTEVGNVTDQPIVVSVDDDVAVSGTSFTGTGVLGTSPNGVGVIGSSDLNYGGYFTSNENIAAYAFSEIEIGVKGQSTEGYGVYGVSGESTGGYFVGNNGGGVVGASTDGYGVYGSSAGGYGVYGYASDGYGGFFSSGAEYSLVAAQSAAKPGGGVWLGYSDARIKENVIPYTKGLAELLLVNTVTYDYNGLAGTTKGAKFTGVIAQEIKEIFPETVNTYKAKLNEEDEEKTELYDFNASDLTFALINAVKELKAEIELLKSK